MQRTVDKIAEQSPAGQFQSRRIHPPHRQHFAAAPRHNRAAAPPSAALPTTELPHRRHFAAVIGAPPTAPLALCCCPDSPAGTPLLLVAQSARTGREGLARRTARLRA